MGDSKESITRMGLYGLIPLAIATAGVWLSPLIVSAGTAYDLHELALGYVAIVASYIAGVGAGGVFSKSMPTPETLGPGMIAAMAAWLAAWPQGALFVSLPSGARFLIAIGVLVYLWLRDKRAVTEGLLPDWYGALRTRLTFWACLFLLAIVAHAYI